MRKNLVVATGLNGEIGKDNDLLWTKQKADMALFKTLTSGATVVMGKNTWESIPEKFRPLPNRINIVVSKTMSADQCTGAILVGSIDEAIARAEGVNTAELWFMGGKGIYQESLPKCDRLVITKIHEEFPEADVHFKESVDLENHGFKLVQTDGEFDADDSNQHAYSHETWEKV